MVPLNAAVRRAYITHTNPLAAPKDEWLWCNANEDSETVMKYALLVRRVRFPVMANKWLWYNANEDSGTIKNYALLVRRARLPVMAIGR